jgi:hypothetical protein
VSSLDPLNCLVLNWLRRFVHSSFVQNWCGQHEYSARAIVARDPQTVLVHSRWSLFSPREQCVRRAFWAVLRRAPTAVELRRWEVGASASVDAAAKGTAPAAAAASCSQEAVMRALCREHWMALLGNRPVVCREPMF